MSPAPVFPCATVVLLQGDAFGDILEGASSFDVVVAEHFSRIGLPKTDVGLFLGMGTRHPFSGTSDRPRPGRMFQKEHLLSAEDAQAPA